MVADPVVRASGLRAVAVATLLAVVVAVARFAVLLASAAGANDHLRAPGLELAQTSIGLTAMTIGVFWIWGTVRAARGDDAVGGGLFALSATVAFAAVAADGVVTLDRLIDPDVGLGEDALTTLAMTDRVCRVAAHLALAIALARLGWHERRGLAMFGAAVVLVVSAPMLAFDPVAMALERSQTSLAGAWWLGTVPHLLVGTGIVTAVWILPVPVPSVWRAIGRSLELIRTALGGLAVIAAVLAAVVVDQGELAALRVASTGSLALFGIAAAVGAHRASRRSIRWARWSFRTAAVVLLALVAIEVVVGALVPAGVLALAPTQHAIAEQVGLALVVVALATLVFGCARVDSALRRPALFAGVLVGTVAAYGIAAVAVQEHAIVQDLAPEVTIGTLLLLIVGAMVMVLRLLGRGVIVAEARAYGERVRAAEFKAEQARLVHERWRAARRR